MLRTTGSRLSSIASTTPALQSILSRALHASSSVQSLERRISQPSRPPRGGGRGGDSRGVGRESRHGAGAAPPRRLDAGRASDRSRSSFGFRPTSQKVADKGRIAPTSSRRLASFDEDSTMLRSRSPRSDRSGAASSEAETLLGTSTFRPPGPRFPHSQSFQPPTYSTPPSIGRPAQAEPRPFTSFDLSPGLLEALTSHYGPEGQSTPVQSLSFSHLLSPAEEGHGLRAILGAETGSGKTLSYLVPMFHQLKSTDAGPTDPQDQDNSAVHPRSIVLSPTHELTRQSTRFAKSLTHTTKLSVMGLSNTAAGGVGTRRGDVDVLLGTVGSVRRMMGIRKDRDKEEEAEKDELGAGLWKVEKEKEGLVRGDRVEWLVIDEADVLLGTEFIDETMSILSKLDMTRLNLVLCTATLPPSLLNLLSSHPLFASTPFTRLLSPGLHKLPAKLEARFVPPSRSGNRLADVAHEVRRVFADDALAQKARAAVSSAEPEAKVKSKIVVFCNSDNKVGQLARMLESKGLPCLAWTGEGEHRVRGRNGALDEFLLKPTLPVKAKTRRFEQRDDLDAGREIEAAAAAAAASEAGGDGVPSIKASGLPPAKSTPAAGSASTPPRILVTTSLLSRGLDFVPSVSSVFLLDPPRDVLDFVHRAGRAGRAGRPGRVVVFGLGDGSGVGQSKDRKGAGQGALQVGQVLNKREIRRPMPGGKVRRGKV
ncbi:hypothetical protein IAU60_006817 [Kwoniella sp. DSM 27419]